MSRQVRPRTWGEWIGETAFVVAGVAFSAFWYWAMFGPVVAGIWSFE